jgi:thiol-disulfide isomerase/thioredoxin
MKSIILFFLMMIFVGCAAFQPKSFSKNALDEKLVTPERDSITLREVLNKNTNKDKFIQVFASYCPVSQASFDDVVAFQKEHPEKEYIFLSVDHTYHDWKRGLEYIKLKGQFYYIPKKGNGDLGKFLKLKSIPRFLKVDKKGTIKVYKTSKVSDKLK